MKLKFRAEKKDIIIFILFSIFLLYVVAIGVINVNSFSIAGTFKGWNPFPAFTFEFLPTTLVFYLLALLGSIFSASSRFFEMEKGFGITTSKKDEKGYTSWMDENDMKKAYDVKKVELKKDTIDAAGVPLINNGKYAWVDDGENHTLIMGASGSGKTYCIMFPLIKLLGKKGESIIVTDPKGELYEGTANFLREKGYKVIILNFRDPSKGSAWNPFSLPYMLYKDSLSDKAKDWEKDKSIELLEDLASNILRDPNNKDNPFWESSASNYFAGLALGLFEDAKESQININSINYMASIGETKLGPNNDYLKEYFRMKGDNSLASINASGIVNAPSDTKGGIVSTFKDKIRIFTSREGMSELLSHSDFDLRDIGREKTALFIKIHDEKTTYHALATVLVKQIYESLIDVASEQPGLRLKYRTNFILDEFANMPALKDVESMITASRSRNIRFTFAIQNFSQLNKVYGKDVSETIKGNCGNFIFLITTELAALEEVSKLCGDIKPPKAKDGVPKDPIRPLITVSDLQNMKKFEVLINRFRNLPFKTKLTPDFKIDWNINKDAAQYENREIKPVDVFDIKKFVDDKRKELGIDNMSPFGGGMGGFPPGFNPFMGSGKNPMGGGNPLGSIFPDEKNNVAPSSGNNGNNINIDDLVKKLDEKIAELEAEEAAEKENQNKSEQKIIDAELESETNTELENKIDNFKEKVKESADISELKTNKDKEAKEKEKQKEIEKPKINVDADSIIVDDNVIDDEFFDDFFGEDE